MILERLEILIWSNETPIDYRLSRYRQAINQEVRGIMGNNPQLGTSEAWKKIPQRRKNRLARMCGFRDAQQAQELTRIQYMLPDLLSKLNSIS